MLRLLAIELHDFKNVASGSIKLSEMPQADLAHAGANVTGVYGQNGSGKTSLIDALEILRKLWSGLSVGTRSSDCIAEGKRGLSIKCDFVVESTAGAHDKPLQILGSYNVELIRVEKEVKIGSEALSFKAIGFSEPMRLCFKFEEGDSIPRPVSFWTSMLPANSEFRMGFIVAQAVAWENSTSLLFSNKFIELFNKRTDEYGERVSASSTEDLMKRATRAYFMNIVILHCARFAMSDFEVIPLGHHALTSLGLLNVITHENLTSSHRKDTFHLSLIGPQMVGESECESIIQTMQTISKPLGALVPGLSIEVRYLGDVVMDDGSPGQRIEILSRRGDTLIPFRCESEGIKKIVTILIALVNVFSNPSACVAIDELDAGVFEYLLGEILEVIDTRGKGQLIFTAHNLIPLEVLSDKSIVFTTANPENRYITFRGHRPTNNLRDQYLRAVNLGGQSETIYEHTSKYEIDNAFYQAGKILRDARDSQSKES